MDQVSRRFWQIRCTYKLLKCLNLKIRKFYADRQSDGQNWLLYSLLCMHAQGKNECDMDPYLSLTSGYSPWTYFKFCGLVQCGRCSATAWAPAPSILFPKRLHGIIKLWSRVMLTSSLVSPIFFNCTREKRGSLSLAKPITCMMSGGTNFHIWAHAHSEL